LKSKREGWYYVVVGGAHQSGEGGHANEEVAH